MTTITDPATGRRITFPTAAAVNGMPARAAWHAQYRRVRIERRVRPLYVDVQYRHRFVPLAQAAMHAVALARRGARPCRVVDLDAYDRAALLEHKRALRDTALRAAARHALAAAGEAHRRARANADGYAPTAGGLAWRPGGEDAYVSELGAESRLARLAAFARGETDLGWVGHYSRAQLARDIAALGA